MRGVDLLAGAVQHLAGMAAGLLGLAAFVAVSTTHPAGPASAGEPEKTRLLVACAASAIDAMTEITTSFEAETGVGVDITQGSSGKFFAQISHGAPFDIYFSADDEYPAKLENARLTSMRKRYARGRIVLWALADAPFDIRKGLSVLAEPGVGKIAVANPRVAPYGRAAIEAFQHAAIQHEIRPKLVTGENISQTAQFVESGAADIGVLSLSVALSPRMAGKGKYWMIPSQVHKPIDADVVVLARSKKQALARRFLEFATSDEAEAIWVRYGLHDPGDALAPTGS